MELMSSLLLCVLVVVPQISGKAKIKPSVEIKFNNSLLIQQKPMLRKPILLNINAPPLVNNSSKIHTIFDDVSCMKCQHCMDRAVNAFKSHQHLISHRPSAEELREDVLTNEIRYRTKRDLKPTDQTMLETPTETAETVAETKTTKKVKTRRNKTSKSVTVTKYDMDGEVYALRVKETQVLADANNDTRSGATCQVYNVKKSYPCDSPDSESLLATARRKANKRKVKKQEQEKSKSTLATTTARIQIQMSSFKKREVDNAQVPENFMPSIEELY